tara:strand:- start:111 stop:287 length:177 start_codon:yes stop_codon:yes gene_type:complete
MRMPLVTWKGAYMGGHRSNADGVRLALIAFIESVEEGIGWDDLIDETVEKILSLEEKV